MSRDLPARPNLEHLKKQAKGLLTAHQRGETAALRRIHASLPSCASLSPEAISRLPFALHDAQSTIAREYGAASWAELRVRVRTARGETAPPEAYQPPAVSMVGAASLTPDLQSLIAEAQARLQAGPICVPTPAQVPALPIRNSLVMPGVVAPLDIRRPSSLRAVEAAERNDPPLLCTLMQRKPEIDAPLRDDLHDIGCLCRLLARRTGDSGTVSLIVEGIRWTTLMAIEATAPYYVVQLADFELDRSEDSAGELARLDQKLRERSRALVKAALPKEACEAALALIDRTMDPACLSDLVLANLTCSPEEQVGYAERTDLVQRLERVLELVEREFTLPAQGPRSN